MVIWTFCFQVLCAIIIVINKMHFVSKWRFKAQKLQILPNLIFLKTLRNRKFLRHTANQVIPLVLDPNNEVNLNESYHKEQSAVGVIL